MVKAQPERPIQRLLTLPQAATYLGRSVYSLRTLIWRGDLQVVQDRRKMRVDVRDLDLWIERNKRTAPNALQLLPRRKK